MKRVIQSIVTVTILTLLVAGSVPAQVEVLHYTWTPPTTGAPVDHYEVEQSVGNDVWLSIGTTVAPEYDVDAPLGWSTIRVRGVSEYGAVGPWSEASRPYENLGETPGFCTNVDYDSK